MSDRIQKESKVPHHTNSHQIDAAHTIVDNADDKNVHTIYYNDNEDDVITSLHIVHVRHDTFCVLKSGYNHDKAIITDVEDAIGEFENIREELGDGNQESEAHFSADYGL